jgi:hypothetical protein
MNRRNARGRRWVRLPLAFGLIWAGIANCNNDASNGNGGGSGTCGELMATYCNKMAECDPVGLRRDFGDVQGCIARQNLVCSTLTLPGTGWDSTKTQQCTAQISSAPSCYTDSAESGACGDVPGMLADGTPCEQSSQCTTRRCYRSSARLPDGGLSNPACGTCMGSDAGTSGCGTGPRCASGQRCVFDASQTAHCVAPLPEGAACSSTAPCAYSFFCKRSTPDAGTAGVCTKRGGSGADCSAANDCDTVAGLRCIAGKCDAPLFVAIGEMCDGTSRFCEKGARCIYPTTPPASMGTCTVPAADGAPCDTSANVYCRSPADCRDGTCHLPGDAMCK